MTTTSQALTASGLGQIDVYVPNGVGMDAVAVASTWGLILHDNGRVLPSSTGIEPAIVNRGLTAPQSWQNKTELKANSSAPIVYSGIDAYVNSAASIARLLNAPALLPQAGASVSHWAQGTPALAQVSRGVQFPALPDGWESVEPGQSRSLSPGAYGNYSIKPSAVLDLTPGRYFFRTLGVEPGAKLRISGPSGGVFVYVKGDFTFRGQQVFEKPSQEVLVASFGQQVYIEAPFEGAIMAPEGTLALGGTTGQSFTGQFFGGYVELRNGATVRLRPFSAGLGDGADDCRWGGTCAPSGECPAGTELRCSGGACTCQPVGPGNGSLDDIELIELGFDIPESIPLRELAVSAGNSLQLGDSVQVGAAVAATAGSLSVGNSTSVGTLSANGDVVIGEAATVFGDIRAGGSAIVSSDATVSGTVQAELGTVPTVHIRWHVTLPTANLGAVLLASGQSRNLLPGRYGTLTAGADSILTLTSGVYGFDAVTIEPGATIRLDDRDGPVQVVIEGGFTFGGKIVSAFNGIPNGVFAVRGTQAVSLAAPFEAALIAPNAPVAIQSAAPSAHRAFVVGGEVSMAQETRLTLLPVDWGTLVGPEFDPEPEGAPSHDMLDHDLDLTVGIPADGGTVTTTTASVGEPEAFTLPEQYTVAGGVIGNGTVVLRYGCGGSTETCTYRGLSSSSEPETPEELIKGSVVQFEGCTDGLPADADRTACTYELEVDPIPNYPVTVQAPMQRRNSCSEEFEILTPEQTREMRENFDWSAATHVPAKDANDKPTLYYSWIYVRDTEEEVALKKLYIHVLTRPFFDAELLQFAGRCGTFVNPGDGSGAFVPALIPGATYNKLIDALSSDEVEGDGVIFDAVILRDIPAEARNSVGSIDLSVLGKSGFKYLDYEADPFGPSDEMVLDGGGVREALTDALTWVAEAARDVGEEITEALNELDQRLRGQVIVHLHARAITHDPSFKDDAMVRGWGRYAGRKLGATGMQVKILQRMEYTHIPTTAQGTTNINGYVKLDATEDADIRGRGLCIDLKTRAARVTSFLRANEICDLRAYDSLTAPEAQAETFRLDTLTSNTTLKLHIDNIRLMGLYQADDVFRYADQVMGYRPKRARILSGRWATTFAELFGKENPDGSMRLSTPCLSFPNTLADAVAAAGTAYGAGEGAFWGGVLGSVFPGIGTGAGAGVGAGVGAAIAGSFVTVLSNTDILMSGKSNLRHKRAVMSHEYGHYMFCNMLYDANEDAVDHLAWATLVNGDDVSVPLRYTNEAFAEYFMGQVASGSNYGWLAQYESGGEGEDRYCSNRKVPCWEDNQRSNLTSELSVGRVATTFLDVFDGQDAERTASVPNDADAWFCASSSDNLTYNDDPDGDHDSDSDKERVALPGSELRTIASYLADGLESFVQYDLSDGFEEAGYAIDDTKLRWAIDSTLAINGKNWCDRCILLALHEPCCGGNSATVHSMWEDCQTEPELAALLGHHPTDPDNLRIGIEDCEPCADNEISNLVTGECEECLHTVVGNTCVECAPDAILQGDTMELRAHPLDATDTSAGDSCPNVFVVEVQDADVLFSRMAAETDTPSLVGGLGLVDGEVTEANCRRDTTLTASYTTPSGELVEVPASGTGNWVCEPSTQCLEPCEGLPSNEILPSDVGIGSSIWFSTPALPGVELIVNAYTGSWAG